MLSFIEFFKEKKMEALNISRKRIIRTYKILIDDGLCYMGISTSAFRS